MKVSDISKLRDEFHPTKNADKRPEDFSYGSGVKLWWLCDKGHEYQSAPNQRTYFNQGCPYCSGRRVTPENNLEVCYPEVASEWDYEKNGGLKPSLYHPKSMKKVWFKCPLGHSYLTVIQSRTQSNSECPRCSNKTSKPELRIYSELKHLFPDCIHRHKIEKTEIDIFIPSINVGIEYDGHYYHQGRETHDQKKNDVLKEFGILLIRLREDPLTKITNDDVMIPRRRCLYKKSLNHLMRKIIETTQLNDGAINSINDYLEKGKFQNEVHFADYSKKPNIPKREKSFLVSHPKFSKFWDYEKNHPLRPEHFTYGSNVEVFWKCNRGHSYKSYIYFKGIHGRGCPICQRQKPNSSTRINNDPRQLSLGL